RLSFFALDAKLIFLRDVVLLGFAINGGDDGRGKLNASHKYVIEDDGIPHRDSVRLFALVLHHLFGPAVLRKAADFILNLLACRSAAWGSSCSWLDVVWSCVDTRR